METKPYRDLKYKFQGHDHGDEEQAAYFILCGKLAVMVGIIYLFWLFESTMALYGKRYFLHG